MRLNKNYHTLRLVLGDQLSTQHSWFEHTDSGVLYVVAELPQEASYVKHHIQKLCAFFLAMETFARALKSSGHHVLYLTLDDTIHHANLSGLISALIDRYSVNCFQYQRPDEYRLRQQLASLSFASDTVVQECDSEHFLLPFAEIPQYVKAQQHNRMESFYRKMRKRFGILMKGEQALGGKWNYDSENRDKLKPKDLSDIPQPLIFSNDVSAIIKRIDQHHIPHFGHVEDALLWPVSREQSLQLLQHFCAYCLPMFGRFQDAMTHQHPDKWTLYHSRLSFSLNSKMLHPREVIDAALAAYEGLEGRITLPQVEGFVRQILGWREYVRCVYWVNMPQYGQTNALHANRDLPGFFWDGNTKMQCMKQAIDQSLKYAYAHHIQRLMITGNFCLLSGVDPKQVDAWYLGIYIDAIEWVEMPNTRGMSQYADGGWVATKPYSAGGNYVNKMSDYCKTCHYQIKEKTSEQACPFNSLYWNFMNTHRNKLANNPRIGMVYRSWDKQSPSTQQATLARAEWCLENLDKI
ncbi:deoxyribodipyrimidine photolyase-related protein [Alteromonadaceae bacterium Bs31]|nr:deoxyribodipyrimidine photolyase-related protein [Alteromonadaceae bacterium Bs31]